MADRPSNHCRYKLRGAPGQPHSPLTRRDMRCLLPLLLCLALIACVAARNPGQFTAPGCGPNSRQDDCSDGCVPSCAPVRS